MTDPTRVLLVCPPLDLRGTTVHTRNLVRALKERNYEFHVAAAPGTLSGILEEEGAVLHHLPLRPGLHAWLQVPRLRKILAEVGPDILHVRHHSLLRVSSTLLWKNKLPLVVSVSTPPAPGPLPISERHTRAVFAVNDPLAEELVARHGVPRTLLTIIRDATFVEDPPARPGEKEEVPPVVGFMGRLEPDRGIQRIPGVARRVLERFPEASFLLVGEGKGDTLIRKWIRTAGLSPKVHVVPPAMDYRKILAGFRLLFSPARKEGLGIFSLEAMAVGRPVVAAAVEGVLANIKDGVTGLLAEPDNEDDMAAKILELLERPGMARALGENARELVRSEFSLEEFAKEVDQAYKLALAPV